MAEVEANSVPDPAPATTEQSEAGLREEVEKLREENKQLKEKVEQQDKEISELKEKVRQQDEDGMHKRKSSFGKGRFARKPRKKASEAAEDGEAPNGAATETNAVAASDGGEPAPETAASPDKKSTPKKKATIRDRLGKAFSRFRTPKGGYEAPESDATSPTSPGGVVIPERKTLTWTVTRSFLRGPRGENAMDEAVLPADEAEYVPFKDWTNEAIREWMIDLELPRYANQCQWSGAEILKASDDQLERELGVKNPLHRKKLRLTLNAISSDAELPKELLKLDVKAVAEWLEYNGVPLHIVETFVDCSVDGRVLTFLSMDDMSYLKVHTSFMQATIKRGIQLLRKHNYHLSYMKPFEEPEPEADMVEPEPSSPAATSAEPAQAENKPKEEGETAEEAKPAEDEAKAEGGEAEQAAEEKKLEEKKPADEKTEAEAAKKRQQRRNEQLAKALMSQKTVVTWSNAEVMLWVRSIQLEDYANRLKDTGVTGALMVLDPCFTPESLCNALGITGKSHAQHDIVAEKLPALLGEEVMGEKDEASKLEGYTPLTPSSKPKKKRSLSFSGALRRKARGEKTTTVPTSGSYLCSLEVDMTEQFIEAHTKDCSVPPEPEEKPEAAAVEASSADKADLDDEADHETVPLVEKDKEEKRQTLAAAAAEAETKPETEEEQKPDEEKPQAETTEPPANDEQPAEG